MLFLFYFLILNVLFIIRYVDANDPRRRRRPLGPNSNLKYNLLTETRSAPTKKTYETYIQNGTLAIEQKKQSMELKESGHYINYLMHKRFIGQKIVCTVLVISFRTRFIYSNEVRINLKTEQ